MTRRCKSIYPGAATFWGKPIRCEFEHGHEDAHGHTFAARYWIDDPADRDSLPPSNYWAEFERANKGDAE